VDERDHGHEHQHDREAEAELTERGTAGQPPGPPVTPRLSPYDRLPEPEADEEESQGRG
jgi:hypothetical protein